MFYLYFVITGRLPIKLVQIPLSGGPRPNHSFVLFALRSLARASAGPRRASRSGLLRVGSSRSKGNLEKSAELAHHYGALATFLGIPFLNAGEVTSTDGVDGIHFTAENNEALGKALARKVEELALEGSAPAGPPTAS